MNLAAEITRVRFGIQEKDPPLAALAIERALELIDLTVTGEGRRRPPFFLREFLRFREVLAEFYVRREKDEQELKRILRTFLDLDPSVHNVGLEL